MKRILFCFFMFVSIAFAEVTNIKVGYPQSITDMYLYMDLEKSEYRGVYVDLLNEFSNENKKDYKFNYTTADEDADILLRVSQTQELEGYNYLVTPFAYKAVVLVDVNSHFRDIDDLYGLIIGYVKNQKGMAELENRNKSLKFQKMEFETENEAILALKNGEVDGIVLKDWNESNPLEKSFRVISSAYFKEKIAVSKQDVELYKGLKEYLSKLETSFLEGKKRENRVNFYRYILKDTPDFDGIKEKYSELKVQLPKEEYFLPIYYRNDRGEYRGLLFEILKDMGKILDIPIRVINSEETPDIVGVYVSQNKDGYLATKPYYKAAVGVASTMKSFALSDVEDLDNSTVIVVNGEIVEDLIKSKTEGVNFITAPTIEEGIKKLLNKEADYLASYYNPTKGIIINKFLENRVEMVGRIGDYIGLSLGIDKSEQELFNVINSVMNSYNLDEVISQTNKNTQVIIKKDYMFMIKILIPMTLIIIVLSVLLKKAVDNRKKAESLGNTLLETMVKVNQLKETESGLHARRIALSSEVLGKKLGLSKNMISKLKLGAIMHDIGKVIVPGNILNKPEKLTAEEFAIVKRHSEFGYEIAKRLELGKEVENAIRFHHENWNGKGYPLGLAGENIPLEGRVIAILDLYDSLREDKVYKKGVSHEEALRIIKENIGITLDPEIAKVFLENEKVFEEIFKNTKDDVDLTSEYYKTIKNSKKRR